MANIDRLLRENQASPPEEMFLWKVSEKYAPYSRDDFLLLEDRNHPAFLGVQENCWQREVLS